MAMSLDDYRRLESVYNDATKTVCKSHFMVVSVDENGVYHGKCTACGVNGATSQAGALALGWIQEETGENV